MRRDFYHLQQKVICDRQVGKELKMKNDFTPEDEFNYANDEMTDYDEVEDEKNYKSAQLGLLMGIGKVLLQIRDELRKMNEGRGKDG